MTRARRVLFDDDFEGALLKPGWRQRGRLQVNSVGAESSMHTLKVADGTLTATAYPVTDGIHHASIGTGEVKQPCDFIISRGWVETRVRFNGFHGAHGSVWLAPATDYEPGQAEIDIVEFFGAHNPDRKTGMNIWQNVHHRLPGQQVGEFTSIENHFGSVAMDMDWRKWNRFKVRIAEGRFEFFINGKRTCIVEGEFPMLPKFLCVSMLCKSEDEQKALTEHGHPRPTMEVDWIRVWDFGN